MFIVLTSNETKPTNCTLERDWPYRRVLLENYYNSPPGSMFPYNGTSPVAAYDKLVQQVWPILTVVLPPANNTHQSAIGSAFAKMTCIRAKNIKQGSRVPSALPKAHAVGFPRSSSWYGVRVGVPVAVGSGFARSGAMWVVCLAAKKA